MSEGPIRLKNAQRAIRDAYFDHNSGLFTLNCVPGAGKSAVAQHLAAEDVLRRYVEGDSTPEQHVAVVSFTRDEASSIIQKICDRLREIVEHELVPVGTQISENELEHLIQRVRRAPYIGTIDSFLRDVFGDIVHEVGFTEMPDVGNAARLRQLHIACYGDIQSNPALAQRLARLEYAYPSEQYNDGVSEMLESAVSYCRDRRLSTEEFRRELERTLGSVYPDGPSESFNEVVEAIRHFVGSDVEEGRYDVLEDDDCRRIVTADARLHDAWSARLDDFCVVFEEYRQAYRDAIRERGVVSHTDVGYLIDVYFKGQIDDVNDVHRTRIKERYQTRIQSLIIDEAQDVSAIQHAALSHLVTPDTRVFGSGDLLQSIYLWRRADPALFESATADGSYLGIDWEIHEHRTATTTFRCRPDVASAINQIAKPILTDPTRGDFGELDVTYPGLDPYREPTNETNVHVAAFRPMSSNPDSYTWCSPVEGRGEAETVATFVSKGLADGTFTADDGTPLDITVLFRWASKMDVYEEAFVDEDLRVRNASENLFSCDVVDAILDLCEWMVAPANTEQTLRVVTKSQLGLHPLEDEVKARDGNLDRVLAECDLTDAQTHALDALISLRDQRDHFVSRPASTYVETIMQALALRADPYGFFPDTDSAQRVANLDALTETLTKWEGDDQFEPRELTEILQPFRENPHLGPNQPSSVETAYDVEFRTVHSAKGDESDVVVIANPGFNLWRNGVQSQRFIKQGGVVGIAPPTNLDVPTDIPLPPFSNGLYNPTNTHDPDMGFRWMTARWCDDVELGNRDTLIGPDRLRKVAENERAEGWRLLYVALTRARDHLVVPLPRSLPFDSQPRDRWLDSIREGLNFNGERSGTYSPAESASSTGSFDIGVNDVELNARRTPGTTTRQDDVAVNRPRVTELEPWVPRFLHPSTMYPLTENPDGYVLAHLLGKSLHTPTNHVSESVPLPFDALGPDDVGTCLHDALTSLVEQDVPEETIRSRGETVHAVLDEILRETVPRISGSERDALFAFFDQWILDDFLRSNLWNLIVDAEEVTVEMPVDGLVSVGDVEFEIHGEADFVLELSSGEQHVADVKIALTELTSETRRRYELQVATYARLFEQQTTSTDSVHRVVETFGSERSTFTPSLPPSGIKHRLARLIDSQ